MPTIVNYGGIVLNSVLTKRFEQEPIYDASHTDVIGSKFLFSFEGICHAQGSRYADSGEAAPDPLLPWIDKSGGSPNVQQIFNAISTQLWQPRQKLTVKMGGDMLFICNPADSNTSYDDIQNGPKPKHVELTHITSNNTIGPTFHVTFDVECVRTACPAASASSGAIQPVLNNRWSIHESFDDEYYTTRTINGEIVLSSAKLPADLYRWLIVPTLEGGFKRDSIDWNIAADGLRVNYVVTDRQIETAPPYPAVKINVEHTEGTANGATFESECHVTLHGAPGAPKPLLFAMAWRILEDRLGSVADMQDDKNKSGVYTIAASMTDTIGDRNSLSVYWKIGHGVDSQVAKASFFAGAAGAVLAARADVAALGADDTNVPNFAGTPVGTLGTPLGHNLDFSAGQFNKNFPKGYNKNVTPVANPWGYAVDGTTRASGIQRLVLQCFDQVPCDANHWIYQSTSQLSQPGSKAPSTDPPPKPADTPVRDNPNLPTSNPSGSSQTLQDPGDGKKPIPVFTHATAETKLSIDPLRAQLPIADDPANWDGDRDTCVFVTLGLPQASIVYYVECECIGQWPNVPQPVANFTDKISGLKGSLLSSVLKPMPPTVDATATKPVYHVSATIVYGLNRPPKPSEKIPIGALQFTSFTPENAAPKLSDLYSRDMQPFDSSAPAYGLKY